ncbi:MAG: amidohydrolase family protein [Candidatus Bathyarchaeia archaeon]|jgi:cytosine/adenosine deaminase-related metal-dependent hydrolase
MTLDLIIRNAYLRTPDGVFDIGIAGDRIEQIRKKVAERGETELDAAGNLVSPGFVDCHTHMDKCLTATGGRFPKYNESRTDIVDSVSARDECIRIGLQYFESATIEEIKKHVLEHAYMQISNGTLWTRTHVDVDSIARTKAVEAVLAAREELHGLIDIQIVAFAQSGLLRDKGSQGLVEKALEMGADALGTVDPATCDNNIECSLDLAFKIAKNYDVDIDHHIMDSGALGIYTLQRLAEKTIRNDYKGRVTASHSYCLSDAPKALFDQVVRLLRQAELKFVTCYSSSPAAMPVKRLLDLGIQMGIGSDNVRDFWIAGGSCDMLQGALIETQRWEMPTNQDMDLIWRMITIEGAKVLGIEDQYGIEVGKKADLVVLDAPSPQWATIAQAKKSYVVKNGRVVAREGHVVSNANVVDKKGN